jgi:hypothetical protein
MAIPLAWEYLRTTHCVGQMDHPRYCGAKEEELPVFMLHVVNFELHYG